MNFREMAEKRRKASAPTQIDDMLEYRVACLSITPALKEIIEFKPWNKQEL